MPSEELIILTRNTLDSLGVNLSFKYGLPDVRKKYFTTNIVNIVEVVNNIEQYVLKNKNARIVICGVSFLGNLDSLRKLVSICKCTLIDSIVYSPSFVNEFEEDIRIVWDADKSSSMMCCEYFVGSGKSLRLDRLIKLIDIYDQWDVKHLAFGIAQDLNDYFWSPTYNGDGELLKNIEDTDGNLPLNFQEFRETNLNEFNLAVKNYEDRKLIHKTEEITILFGYDWFHRISHSEMSKGKDFVLGFTDWGLVQVRVNNESKYTNDELHSLRLQLVGDSDTGSLNAFMYKFKNKATFDDIIGEAQRVTKAIQDMSN
jgi:hypothetical protein